jgi:four helix bundle protein
MSIRSYRDLLVWQKATGLVELIYTSTDCLPAEEKYGLCSQMNRAAVSIPSNIAEGFGRMHRKAYANHCSIARGSVMELRTQIELCVRRGLVDRDAVITAWRLPEEVAKMLSGLIGRLRRSPVGPPDA